ncbi:putative antigen E [Crotalus adamanteus]|uniref:Antigen E n=1 Tax=Crotalus adamanteus TaxID=8729 RepID=A0AAW1BA00_CROAD
MMATGSLHRLPLLSASCPEAMGPRPAKSQVSIIAPGGEKKTQMNPFSNVSSTVLWILLASLATVCLVVLTVVSYLCPLAARSVRVFPRTLLASQERPRGSPRSQEKDAALVSKPPHPLEESMKRLGTTMAVGLRSPKLKHENPQKVAEEAVRLPDHIKDCGKTFNEQKRKYHSLFRKSQKSATEWQPFGSGLYYVSRGKKSWYDAENFCLSREAHLTSILSSEEQNHVTLQLTQPAWIGLTDGGRGKWEWTDGSRLIAQ